MTYYLGVDLGTTYSGAAAWRDRRVDIVSLGNRAATIPSVVLLRDDEEILTGEAASRRAVTEPERVAREFKRRMGDPTPIIVGGTPYSAASLTGKLLRWIVDKVSELQGEDPSGIVVSYPANWGEYKQDLLAQAIQIADLDDVSAVTEPEAAAINYASEERVAPGEIVAVYDLGGGTFDAAVLERTADGFEIRGEPQGVERLGGVDFDEAVYQYVVRATGGALEELDASDPASVAAVARLRQDCIEAKEALSADTDVSIPILLPNLQTEVRLTRREFEDLIRPALADTITSMNRALRSAGVTPDDVSAVLLVGGSSRIPLVAQLVGAELGRPVAVDSHPKHLIALGAAIVAAERAGALEGDAGAEVDRTTGADAAPGVAAAAPAGSLDPTAESPDVARPTEPAAARAAAGHAADRSAEVQSPSGKDDEASPPSSDAAAPPPPRETLPPPSGLSDGGRRPALLIVAGIVAVVAALAVVVLLSRGDGDDGAPVAVGTAPTATATPTPTAEAGAVDDGATQAASPTETATPAPTGPFVRVDDVSVEDDNYRVEYTVFNYEPVVSSDPETLHIHFFLNPPTTPENAGTNGNPPGEWNLTDEPSSFLTSFGPADAQSGAQVCSVVATYDHEVFDPDSGNCVDVP